MVIVAGCTTTKQLPIADFNSNTDTKLPIITLFHQRPTDTFLQECAKFEQMSVLHHCEINQLDLSKLQTEIKAANSFEDVILANNDVDYQLTITTGTYQLEEDADIKVNTALYWNGFRLKNFNYAIPVQLRVSAPPTNQDTEQNIAKSIASHILRDLQAEDLFSAQYLANKLDSTDYATSVKFPDQAGKYLLQGEHVYTHPLSGIQARYWQPEQIEDYIDVFVYPVRSPYWNNSHNDILSKEIDIARKEVDAVLAELEFTDITFTSTSNSLLHIHHQPIEVYFFEHEYTDLIINTYISNTYLTIVGDKFIKVRHTALKDAASKAQADEFIQTLLSDIQVPGESLFMAKLRQQWRDKEQL